MIATLLHKSHCQEAYCRREELVGGTHPQKNKKAPWLTYAIQSYKDICQGYTKGLPTQLQLIVD